MFPRISFSEMSLWELLCWLEDSLPEPEVIPVLTVSSHSDVAI
jgi:hypothetical protein